jgi:restriction system protein
MMPEERLDLLVRAMNLDLPEQRLKQRRTKPAAFFEHVVVRLLVQMGYGGSFGDAGQANGRAIGRIGDGGIDGIIKRDRLGLDNVDVPARRFAADRSVGADVVRNLAQIGSISLVDGEQLAHLMIEFDLGVAAAATYKV